MIEYIQPGPPPFGRDFFKLKLDASESSLLRELIPILATIITHGEKVLSHLTVAFYTDNSGVPCVLKGGSRNGRIHNIALAIDNALTRFDIVTFFIWVPREEEIMVAVDKASLITDYHSYTFTHSGFASFFAKEEFNWPTPELDLFADRRNARCANFFSQTTSEGCAGVHALSISSIWPTELLLYALPPAISHTPVVFHRAPPFSSPAHREKTRSPIRHLSDPSVTYP